MQNAWWIKMKYDLFGMKHYSLMSLAVQGVDFDFFSQFIY